MRFCEASASQCYLVALGTPIKQIQLPGTRTDGLPESIIFEVLSANPDELKKQELMEHLETKPDPLPEYMIEILESLTGNVTYKTILQGQMAYHGSKEARAAGILLRDMLNDSLRDEAAIHGFMAARQNLPMDMQLVDAYLERGQAADALALAGMLPQLYNLTGDALAEHGRYKIVCLTLPLHALEKRAGVINSRKNEKVNCTTAHPFYGTPACGPAV